MRNSFHQMVFAASILCALLLSACDSGGDMVTPPTSAPIAATPTPTVRSPALLPTATSAPAVAPTVPTAIDAGGTRDIKTVTSGLEKLTSYRAHLAYRFDGKDKRGQPKKGALELNNEVSHTSANTTDDHFTLITTGTLPNLAGGADNNKDNTYELYAVGGESFSMQSGLCQFQASDSAGPGAIRALFTLDDFFGSMNKAVRVRRAETVNGVSADHYTITAFSGAKRLAGFKIQKGDVWIAADGYVVKTVGIAAGKASDGLEGTVTWDYNVAQINQTTITLPTECVALEPASDVPLPANAMDKRVAVAAASGETLTTFKSPDALKTVGDFFRQALARFGWRLDSDKASGLGAIQLAFSKDNGKRTLTINIITQSTGSSVITMDKQAQ